MLIKWSNIYSLQPNIHPIKLPFLSIFIIYSSPTISSFAQSNEQSFAANKRLQFFIYPSIQGIINLASNATDNNHPARIIHREAITNERRPPPMHLLRIISRPTVVNPISPNLCHTAHKMLLGKNHQSHPKPRSEINASHQYATRWPIKNFDDLWPVVLLLMTTSPNDSTECRTRFWGSFAVPQRFLRFAIYGKVSTGHSVSVSLSFSLPKPVNENIKRFGAQ